jgi:hypothetical protein
MNMVSFALRRQISLLTTVMAPALVGFPARATHAAANPFHSSTALRNRAFRCLAGESLNSEQFFRKSSGTFPRFKPYAGSSDVGDAA